MKRRPGVERRRRRLAFSVNSLLTYMFHHEVPEPKPKNFKSGKTAGFTPQQQGFYYEAMILKHLALISDGDKNYVAMFDGQQKNAYDAFQRLTNRQWQAKKLRDDIEKAAKVNVDKWYQELKKNTEGKDVTIQVGNIQASSPIGDALVKIFEDGVEKNAVVFEAKWQTGRDIPVHWFTLNDGTLFGAENFFSFIYNHPNYWSHDIPGAIWEKRIAINALSSFLGNRFGGSIFSYLLNKGEVSKAMSKLSSGPVSKVVAHGMRTTAEITDISKIENDFAQIEQRSSFERVWYNPRSSVGYYKYVLLFEQAGEEIATFGINSYRYEKTTAVKQNGKKVGEYTSVRDSGDRFSFMMYINQKVLAQRYYNS